jgi:hypothetical protein
MEDYGRSLNHWGRALLEMPELRRNHVLELPTTQLPVCSQEPW